MIDQLKRTVMEHMVLIAMTIIVGLLQLLRSHLSQAPAPAAPQIEIKLVGNAAVFTPKVQATIYSATWCVPCQVYKKAILEEMPKEGWVVREAGDKDVAGAHLILDLREDPATIAANKITSFPTTVIRKNENEVYRFAGRVSPTQLADLINKYARE